MLLAAAAVWSGLVVVGALDPLDDALGPWLRADGPDLWVTLTRLGDTGFLFVAVPVALAGLWLEHRRRTAWALGLLMLLAWGLIEGLKLLAHRARPDGGLVPEDGFAYPSGHSLASLVFYGAWGLSAGPAAARWGIAVGVGVGVTRLLLGVHHVSDVVGSWLIAAALLVLAYPGLVAEEPAVEQRVG